MELKQALQLLQKQSDEIKELAVALEYSGEVRAIEVDLILDKLRRAYDLARNLDTNTGMEISDTEVAGEAPEPKVDSVEKKVEEAPREIEFEVNMDAEEVIDQPEMQGTPGSDEKSLVADQFQDSTSTLNDEISGDKKVNDLSSKLSLQPISSITNALGLNEKFELINELFGGNQQQYDLAMVRINKASSFVEAYTYMDEELKWDMENEYVQRILELIRRKLIVRRDEQ